MFYFDPSLNVSVLFNQCNDDLLNMCKTFQLENRIIVKRTFSKAIVNYRCLSKDKAELLVLFIMDNRDLVFQVLFYNSVGVSGGGG